MWRWDVKRSFYEKIVGEKEGGGGVKIKEKEERWIFKIWNEDRGVGIILGVEIMGGGWIFGKKGRERGELKLVFGVRVFE